MPSLCCNFVILDVLFKLLTLVSVLFKAWGILTKRNKNPIFFSLVEMQITFFPLDVLLRYLEGRTGTPFLYFSDGKHGHENKVSQKQ